MVSSEDCLAATGLNNTDQQVSAKIELKPLDHQDRLDLVRCKASHPLKQASLILVSSTFTPDRVNTPWELRGQDEGPLWRCGAMSLPSIMGDHCCLPNVKTPLRTSSHSSFDKLGSTGLTAL